MIINLFLKEYLYLLIATPVPNYPFLYEITARCDFMQHPKQQDKRDAAYSTNIPISNR